LTHLVPLKSDIYLHKPLLYEYAIVVSMG